MTACLRCENTGSYADHAPDCDGGAGCWRTCPVQVQCDCGAPVMPPGLPDALEAGDLTADGPPPSDREDF